MDVAKASVGRFGPEPQPVYAAWDVFADWAASLAVRPSAGDCSTRPRWARRFLVQRKCSRLASITASMLWRPDRAFPSFRGLAPIGPVVTPSEFPDPGELAVTYTLNGETVHVVTPSSPDGGAKHGDK